MTTRTHVTVRAQVGISDDEARNILGDLVTDRPFGPVEVWRSNVPGTPKTVFVSLEGDVEQQVRAKLQNITLPFTVEVMRDM